MKLIKAIAATACALALATAAQAETYTDSSENYEMGHGLATGDNGGTGFGAWVVESHGSGDGWAGCGIWDPSANDFQGAWAGKERAFGIIGKGDSYGINAYRPFRAPLAVGDSFSLEMGVNWDPNSGIDALKGFALLAKGGTFQALTINHRSNPGDIAINGKADSDILNAFGTYPMKWTFTAKDETTIHVTATPRDGSDQLYEEDWEVETSAIDGFRIQSSGQNPYEDEQAAQAQGETAQMWADRRQTYFDNFVLDIAAELPDLLDLEFTGGDWSVTSNNQELSYTLSRPSSDGELTVNIKSSFEAFIPSTTATFADGETETTFKVTATLQPKAENKADLTATAIGCNPAVFENVRAPRYRFSSDTASVEAGESANIWINWDDNGVRDDSKLAFVADPEGIVSLPASWELADEAKDGDGNYIGYYAQTSISGVASGYTLLALTYDGVVVGDWGFTVPAPLVPGFELSGPQLVKPGQTYTYSLKATLTEEELGCTVSFDPADAATADPDSFNLADPAGDGFYYQDIEVTFGDNPGDVTITVASDNYSADLDVTIKAPVDPSKFDDFIAYDDASLYDGEFDMNSLGAGSEGFSAWTVFKNSAQYGGALVTDADNGFPSILTEGSALALYANGENPDYALCRPFVNDLQPGQKASVEFVVPDASGTFYVQFARVWEGTPYNRFEVWSSGGKVGVNIDGAATDSKELSWTANPRRIVASVQLAADGTDYTLSLSGYNEGSEFVDDIYTHVVDSDVGSWSESIQGIVVGGYDLGKDMIFNKLIIEQVEEPVKVRAIGWGEGVWNPEGDGTYEITLTATAEDIGEVAISVEPAEGNTGTLELASDTLDLDGATSATISYTLSGVVAGDSFKISAVPADTTVAALEGESAYGVSVIEPFLTLSCNDGWQFTTDTKEIWLSLSASPSKFGTYTLVSSDPSVLALSVESIDVPNAEGDSTVWFNVFVKGVGNSTISLAEDESVNWGFEISEGSQPEPIDIDAEVVTFEKGSMKFKLPEGGTIMTTTNLVTGPWVDFPAEVGEDGAVVIPTTGDGAFYRIGEPPATVVDDEGE